MLSDDEALAVALGLLALLEVLLAGLPGLSRTAVHALFLLFALTLAGQLRGLGIGGPAGDRLPFVLVGVIDLLALDLDPAAVLALQRRRAELGLGTLVIRVVALGPAEGEVLGLVVGPVLQRLGRFLLEILDLLLRGLVALESFLGFLVLFGLFGFLCHAYLPPLPRPGPTRHMSLPTL
jgi:hypothetical protein